VDGKEMINLVLPPQRDLLKGILREKSLSFLAGEEGSGKSLLAMNLGLCIATGGRNFLSWDVQRSGRVLFLNYELYFEDFVFRFRQMVERKPGPEGIDNFAIPKAVPPVVQMLDFLRDYCKSYSPALIVLDCLYYSHNEDENDPSKMKALLRLLQAIRDDFATCVLVVHHFRKGGRFEKMNSELMRGAGVFGQAADSVLMMRRSRDDESKRVLKPAKLRHSGDHLRDARLLSLDPRYLWFRDEGVTKEEDHLECSASSTSAWIPWSEVFPEGKEMQFSEILAACRPMGHSDKTTQRALAKEVKEGRIVKTKHGWYTLPHAPGAGGGLVQCPNVQDSPPQLGQSGHLDILNTIEGARQPEGRN
ncbi:MAG: AAA family ATPase, partial [Bacteroidota bacterium]